jgi:hypothetical protein
VINPELYYELWKQEHCERLRAASRWHVAPEAGLTRIVKRFWERKGSISIRRNWLGLLTEGPSHSGSVRHYHEQPCDQ